MTTASELLSVLSDKVWPKESHAWLYEVANGTGSRARRWADAVVCSCWPSRGLFLLGIEVKVSRSDWIKEFKTPEKSWPVQQFCSYWWLATTPDVCKPEELPETWGLVVVDGKKHAIVKPAPKLQPEALTIEFIASLLRKESGNRSIAEQIRINDIVKSRVDVIEEENRRLQKQVAELGGIRAFDQLRELQDKIKVFEEKTGLDLSRWGNDPLVEAETLMLARRLMAYNGAAAMIQQLEELAAAFKALNVKDRGDVISEKRKKRA